MNNLSQAQAYFDESKYLNSNPDVKKAVKDGVYASGWVHFLIHGYYENRKGVSADLLNAVKKILIFSDNEPVPPEHLRNRVHGHRGGVAGFESVGKIISLNIYSEIDSILNFDEHSRVFDFGCGCGRIIRYLYKIYGNCEFYGSDIDPEAITWCEQHLSHIGKFSSNENFPPLDFEDSFFDFGYAISIFTHLPEDMQFEWLDELRRVTRPGGYLILTTHGKELFTPTSKQNMQQFKKTGFDYSQRFITEGLPDFYKTTFHTEKYIHKNWSRYFKIIKIIKKGIANHQDLILCRRT